MKITGAPTALANTPEPEPPKNPDPPFRPDLLPSKASHRPQRRRTRLRRAGAPTGKGSSKPQTPLLKWKTEEGEKNAVSIDNDEDKVSPPEVCRRRRRRKEFVSARKLAAVLWRLNLVESVAPGGGGGRLPRQSREEAGAGHVAVPFLGHRNSRIFGSEAKDPAQRSASIPGTRNGSLYKLEPSFQFSNSAMEGATKWNPISFKTSEEARKLYTHGKLLNLQVGAASVISSLEAELEQAQALILELESERRTSKKKLEHFVKKVSEEKAAWRRREHEKIRAFVNDMKSDLNRERKSRQRMELVNSKLVDELAEAKLSAKRYMQDYEKERKTREMIEEVCDELVKEMEEDKAELEALKEESVKFRDEVEEERKMLQMAEVWREERVQMKLVDANVALEEKYSQMNNLVANLENFLSKLRSSNPDLQELKEAEFLRQAAASVNIQEIKEFTYEPSNPDDIFAVLEEVNLAENKEREIEACNACSPASRDSKVHSVSPEEGVIRDQKGQRHSNAFLSQNKGDIEDDESGWETVSHLEEQGSSYSPEGSRSAPSAIKNQRDSNVSGSGSETSVTETSDVCSAPAKQPKKVSSIARLWRSCPNNGENINYKLVPMEGMNNGRLSNARISNGGVLISPDRGSGKGGYNNHVGEWSSPENGNPHITRAMKGCIEWPRGAQKNSLKAKLLEARMESQKVQLRQVLKQKM